MNCIKLIGIRYNKECLERKVLKISSTGSCFIQISVLKKIINNVNIAKKKILSCRGTTNLPFLLFWWISNFYFFRIVYTWSHFILNILIFKLFRRYDHSFFMILKMADGLPKNLWRDLFGSDLFLLLSGCCLRIVHMLLSFKELNWFIFDLKWKFNYLTNH